MHWDAIWNRARADLVITTEQGGEDLILWEHSVRVSETARQIARLPEVQAASPDEAAIVAAALYHDAGWVARLRDSEIRRGEILCRLKSEAHREHGALMLEHALGELLPRDTLQRASGAIRTLKNRRIESVEGQVITEADNLDELGVLSLWSSIRRGVTEGKGVQAVIDTWRRRKEYRFWEAHLKDSFRFAPVRAVAEKRLEQLERLMRELEGQHTGADIVLGLEPSSTVSGPGK